MKKQLLLLVCIFFIFDFTNAQTWSAVGTGIVGPVYTLASYNGSIYAGGTIVSAGGNYANNIARWDGVSWSSPDSGVDGNLTCMTVYNGELVVGGTFNSASGIPAIDLAQWDGTSWTQ